MTLVRWNPFCDLDVLQREVSRLFDGNILRSSEEDFLAGSWTPQVDIFEDGEAITVSAALPGLSKKDIKINIENHILTIAGERKLAHEDKSDNYTRVEQFYGSFYRSFTLPNTIDAGKIDATMDQGILKVTLPKREETKPKQIEVKVK